MVRIILSVLVYLVAPSSAFAGIDATFSSVAMPVAEAFSAVVFFKIPIFGGQLTLVVLWLMIGGVFLTIQMGFVNIRAFKHAIQLARGDYVNPNDTGEVSHFQALATAQFNTVRNNRKSAHFYLTAEHPKHPTTPEVSGDTQSTQTCKPAI